MRESYFGYLRSIIKNPEELRAESGRLELRKKDLIAKLSRLITNRTAGSLIWALGVKELMRIQGGLVGQPLSDFAGQAQLLRAVAASTPFKFIDFKQNPDLEACLEICESLWIVMGWHVLVVDLVRMPDRNPNDVRSLMACQMSLLKATQRELLFIEQAEDRISRLFRPFSAEIVEAETGMSTDLIIAGMAGVRDVLKHRLQRFFDQMTPMMEKYTAYREGKVHDPQELFESELEQENMGRTTMDGFQSMNTICNFGCADLEAYLGLHQACFWSSLHSLRVNLTQHSTPHLRTASSAVDPLHASSAMSTS